MSSMKVPRYVKRLLAAGLAYSLERDDLYPGADFMRTVRLVMRFRSVGTDNYPFRDGDELFNLSWLGQNGHKEDNWGCTTAEIRRGLTMSSHTDGLVDAARMVAWLADKHGFPYSVYQDEVSAGESNYTGQLSHLSPLVLTEFALPALGIERVAKDARSGDVARWFRPQDIFPPYFNGYMDDYQSYGYETVAAKAVADGEESARLSILEDMQKLNMTERIQAWKDAEFPVVSLSDFYYKRHRHKPGAYRIPNPLRTRALLTVDVDLAAPANYYNHPQPPLIGSAFADTRYYSLY